MPYRTWSVVLYDDPAIATSTTNEFSELLWKRRCSRNAYPRITHEPGYNAVIESYCTSRFNLSFLGRSYELSLWRFDDDVVGRKLMATSTCWGLFSWKFHVVFFDSRILLLPRAAYFVFQDKVAFEIFVILFWSIRSHGFEWVIFFFLRDRSGLCHCDTWTHLITINIYKHGKHGCQRRPTFSSIVFHLW